MQVIKRDGSKEKFDISKINKAVEKAFNSCNKKMPQYLYDMFSALFGTLEGDTIGIEEIQNKVEDILMNDKYFEIIENSWKQNPKERLTINQIENELNELYINYIN